MNPDHGSLIGIARKAARRAPVEELEAVLVTAAHGVEGDNRGRFARRAVTILAVEDWRRALADLDPPRGDLPWTTRRANLLVEGVRLPRAYGARIAIGPVELEVTGQTSPCSRMEEQCAGLLKALAPEWRGGVTCRVIEDGRIAVGDPVRILTRPPERPPRRLP